MTERFAPGLPAPILSLFELNIRDIRRFAVSLPPLGEQKRIVAKVESLLALCETLAGEVVAAEEVRGRLLQAVLNGA